MKKQVAKLVAGLTVAAFAALSLPTTSALLCASGDVTGGVVPPDTTAWFTQP